MVVPVLDSGNTAALGYAAESGIPYEQALIRNHYVRRTFIEPAQAIRERSDVCAVPAAAVVGEAMVAIVLADAMLEKFGGDSLGDMRAAYEVYLERMSGSGDDG